LKKIKDYPEIIKLLNRKSWTKKHFEEKLLKKDFLQSETESIIIQAQKLGLIDDNKWAKMFISKKNTQIKSNREIKQYFLKEGICREIIDKIIDERNDRDACIKAIEYKKKRIPEKKQDKKKILYNYLLSRGFSSEAIYGLLKIEQ
jgi:SOS response regulatory protein OraA/RecX